MTSKLGCHWQRTHPDQRDMPHVQRMRYPSVKLFKNEWDNRDFCRELLTVLPRDAYILARDHALSEQKEDMWRDAEAAGNDHASQWIGKVQSGQYHLPLDRSFFLGINEPDATHGDRDKIDIYTATFLRRLSTNGLRGGAFNFSTGHPRTVDGTPNTPADYSVFERSHRAIVEGNHIAVLHIYGTGAVPCAPGHFDRLKACTWQDVVWVVGEMGIDEHVIGGGKHIGFHGYFEGHLHDYCAWLDTLILGINDSRIHSYQVFTYDHASPWESFDTHPIRDALESYSWRHMQPQPTTPSTPPSIIHIPAVGTGTQPATLYVIATAGLNLRDAPGTGKVLAKLPYGSRVTMIAPDAINPAWFNVRYENTEGYAYSHYLSTVKPDAPEQPTPAPQPVPSGDCWQRAWPIVLKIEGGLSTDRNDKGNYRPDGTFVGTRWGISANAHPDVDIVNLSKEDALKIYHRDYFLASGADRLEWPMCLLHFDAYVQNPNAAKKFLTASNGDPVQYMADRIDWYTDLETWQHHGRGWMRRCATMLREVAKAKVS